MGIVVIGTVYVDVKGYPAGQYDPKGRNAGRIVQVHGGVGRNIAEDIANIGLAPSFVGLVDESGNGQAVIERLNRQGVDTTYLKVTPDGMGTWLAIFDSAGDVAGSISVRPNLLPIAELLEKYGDEIFAGADSIAVEIDMDQPIIEKCFELAEKHKKKVFGVVSNMTIALERRAYLRKMECFVCNQQEAGILFADDYEEKTPEEMAAIAADKVMHAGYRKLVITMGGQGAVYACADGESGFSPAMKVTVKDTTGAGDSFFAGVTAGLTYGKTLKEACAIGSRLAASVITTGENVCPHFLSAEFGL